MRDNSDIKIYSSPEWETTYTQVIKFTMLDTQIRIKK